MYYDGDIISSSKGILFESPSDPQVITISDHMSLDALRKIIIDAIGGCTILLDIFYRQPIYVGDDCVEYECMKLKRDNCEWMYTGFDDAKSTRLLQV